MKNTVSIAALVFVCSTVFAADPERYRLKGDADLLDRFPGYASGRAEYELPFDKSYGELTPTQQERVKSAYVDMGESDEPPFPVGGLQTIYRPIAAGQQRGLMASGPFRADVEVDEQGSPIAFAVYQSPSESVTQFVANIVMLTKFKPALCSGSRCRMGFPVRITFETS